MDITLIRDELSGVRSYGGDPSIPGPTSRYESSPIQLTRYKSFWAVNLRLRRNKGGPQSLMGRRRRSLSVNIRGIECLYGSHNDSDPMPTLFSRELKA